LDYLAIAKNLMKHYDYIIIGAGASGLMLGNALVNDPFFKEKSILLVDKNAKLNNDRTWCFWEEGKGAFDTIVSKTWHHIYFGGQQASKTFDINPYFYKMIRGIDFYDTYLTRLKKYPNISFKQESITQVTDEGNRVIVTSDKSQYTALKVFNSIFDYKMAMQQDKYPVLQQHFLGWTVKTKEPIFKVDRVTYMDFSIPQLGNTRFMYILPFSETEALVEYTLFSEKLLSEKTYENSIRDYLKNELDCHEFEIMDTEKGSIPMTCYDFKDHHTKNIRYIGTAGGWAKPSTGYTFISSSKKVPVLLQFLKTGRPLHKLSFKNKFWYYDLLLLDVLANDNANGHTIFETLFKNRNPELIFKFLDEETSLLEDLQFILGCPKWPFFYGY